MHYKPLPYDYEVKYLESTLGTKIVTDIFFDTSTQYTSVFGFGEVSSRTPFSGIYGASQDGYWSICSNGTVETSYLKCSDYSVSNKICTFYRANGVKKCDDISIVKSGNSDSGWFTRSTYPLTIFAGQFDRTGNCEGIRFYSATIESHGAITNELVPVVDKQGIGCLYDKVSGKLFYNQGTGEFIVGPKV